MDLRKLRGLSIAADVIKCLRAMSDGSIAAHTNNDREQSIAKQTMGHGA